MLSRKRYTDTEVPRKTDQPYRLAGPDSNIVDQVNKIVDANTNTNTNTNMNMNTNTNVTNPSMNTNTANANPNANYVININSQNDGMIIVETDHNAKRFAFYTPQQNYLGGFTVLQFIKYITSNVSDNFLQTVDYCSVSSVIEKYIGSVKKVDGPTVRYDIRMLNYVESPFMGNADTLLKFYTFINEFEVSRLQIELSNAKMAPDEAIRVKNIFDQMVYTLLTHILKIIAALTNKIVDNKNNPDLVETKNNLLRYSVSIMYKLSKFIKHEVDSKIQEIDRLDTDLLRIESIRSNMTSRMNRIEQTLNTQMNRNTPITSAAKDSAKDSGSASASGSGSESDTGSESASASGSNSDTSYTSYTTSVLTPSKDQQNIIDLNRPNTQTEKINTDVSHILKKLDNRSDRSTGTFIKGIPGIQVATPAPSVSTTSAVPTMLPKYMQQMQNTNQTNQTNQPILANPVARPEFIQSIGSSSIGMNSYSQNSQNSQNNQNNQNNQNMQMRNPNSLEDLLF